MHKHEIRANTPENVALLLEFKTRFSISDVQLFAVPYLDSRGHSVIQACCIY